MAAATYPTGAGPRGITVGDLNGDGQFDVVTANGSSNNVTVYFGAGSAPLFAAGDFAVGTNPSSVTIGDVDGDGFADICADRPDGHRLECGLRIVGNGCAQLWGAEQLPDGELPGLLADRRPQLRRPRRPRSS